METKKTLNDYIKDAKMSKNYFAQSLNCEDVICLAFPETDYHGDIIDPVVWSMQCDSCGGNVVYTWFDFNGNDVICSRQVVKYGKKPGTCDGGDLTPYITKYGRKYWLDDFVRIG